MSTPPSCEPNTELELITGWGRASHSAARVVHIESQEHLERVIAGARRSATPILARGLGRSYGDAAQNAGGIILDCTGLDRIIETDFACGTVRVEAGISLDVLLRLLVPNGWFVPVTPGTRQVTIGGAIAADVHGKNHHQDGAFGAYVQRLALVDARGRIEASPTIHSGLFWSTVGGMGLTGAIAEATLRLSPIETAYMVVDTERAASLEECMAELDASDGRYRYSVAWVDCSARGRHLGRSVLSRGDHARVPDLPARQQTNPLGYRPTTRLNVPFTSPCNLVAPTAVRAANQCWYRKAPVQRAGEIQSLSSFFYPLDAVANWNRLYGPCGFTQYQFVVPFGKEAIIRTVLEVLQSNGAVPSLGVLKCFGDADPAPLSFPRPGWTLALDLPLARRDVGGVLDRLDGLIADAGGRVYLAKDVRLRPELFRVMYPRLDEWLATRDRVDLPGVFASDLSRRLGVVDY